MISEPEIYFTDDGSPTLFNRELNTHYHSTHGALQESEHVFIDAGLAYIAQKKKGRIHIFEIGTGTGLHALLAYRYAQTHGRKIRYTGLEPYPPAQTLMKELASHFAQNAEESNLLNQLYVEDQDNPSFSTNIIIQHFADHPLIGAYDLVFLDAFSPDIQPELWTQEVFEKLYAAMTQEAALVTYCAKGAVRRAMQAAGFTTERLPGAKGKREMLRANKF